MSCCVDSSARWDCAYDAEATVEYKPWDLESDTLLPLCYTFAQKHDVRKEPIQPRGRVHGSYLAANPKFRPSTKDSSCNASILPSSDPLHLIAYFRHAWATYMSWYRTLVLHHLKVLLDSGLESLGVGTDDLADLLAVLEQHKGGHGADTELLGDIGDLVDVDLEEADVGVGVGEPVQGEECG